MANDLHRNNHGTAFEFRVRRPRVNDPSATEHPSFPNMGIRPRITREEIGGPMSAESTAGVAGSASRPANNNSPLARVSSWPPNFTGPTGPHSTGKGTLQGLARCDPRCLVEASRGDRHALPPHCLREARRALPSGGSMYARRSAGAAAQDQTARTQRSRPPGAQSQRTDGDPPTDRASQLKCSAAETSTALDCANADQSRCPDTPRMCECSL
ncbi:hypothetical protein Bbelb_331580 [Branchiostoma belcheri]|nr:hypothetical protein Bbelb_331580 [Branchiostoma belcheri]